MPTGQKRRHFHGRSQRKSHDANQDGDGGEMKRRRLSETGDGCVEQPARKLGQKKDATREEGWEIVTSKRAKRITHDAEISSNSHHEDDPPTLRFYQNFKGDIKIKDLRNLALYILADEVAPNWLAINNARNVKKVVGLMVPGLDQQLLKQGKELFKKREVRTTNGSVGEAIECDARGPFDEHDPPSSDSMDNFKTPIAQKLVINAKKSKTWGHDIQDWLFQKILNVTAPGDYKQSRVHSPLQAMLLTQESEVKKNTNATSGNYFKPTRIPIIELIHTADELREAEYPIHPAAFTSQPDAQLEMSRREQTGQCSAHGWVDTDVTKQTSNSPKLRNEPKDFISQDLKIYALDCEMVLTSDDVTSLARISLIEYPDGTVVLDKYVKPALPVKNYFTQYSGITPAHLENVTTTLQDIQQELLKLLDSETVLLGHSLESDLNALKLTHPFIVDTSMIYPHPRGLPLRSSLKFLANKYLKREIQTGGVQGHDSVEDARAVLDLVKLKCEKGLKWGTTEANGEAIFKRLARNARTSSMVEYGTPERGLGKDATWTIGCQDDDEIVSGIARSVQGDSFFDFEIAPQGVDFVWARLRALEFARGWVSSPGSFAGVDTGENKRQDSANEKETGDTQDPNIISTLEATFERLQQIYESLPERTLLVVFSGTSDMRPVLKLQAMQQQYRKEFKTKKWDELSVRWTDTEEQALKRACEEARQGWGAVVIK